MAEKKIQENPLEENQLGDNQKEMHLKSDDKPNDTTAAPTNVASTPVLPQTRVCTIPAFTKAAPNDLYRRLLPAALFLLTFVTVMTMLLIYMDTVALGAQQFRLNMSRDYELRQIAQDDPSLVAYVRQLHLAPQLRGHHDLSPSPTPDCDDRTTLIEKLTGDKYNGTFVEILTSGERDCTTSWLENNHGWKGLVVRAAPRDYLALRAAQRQPALHACLSPTKHPREVSYTEWSEDGGQDGGFNSRVLCLPLYTMLLAAEATQAQYLLIGGHQAYRALSTLPFERCHLQIIEVRVPKDVNRHKTTTFLQAHNYTVKAEYDDAVVYANDKILRN